MIFWATEIKVRAERRTGELLRSADKHPGVANGRPGPGRGVKTRSSEPTGFSPPKLSDLKISKQQSADWQQLAAIRRRVRAPYQRRGR